MKELQPRPLDGEILPPLKKERLQTPECNVFVISLEKTIQHHRPTYVIHVHQHAAETEDPLEMVGELAGAAMFTGLALGFRGIAALIERRRRRDALSQKKIMENIRTPELI